MVGGRGRDRTGDPLLAKQVLCKLFSPAKLCNLILYQIPTTAHGTALTSIRGPIRSKNAPFSQKVESLIRFAARLPDRRLTSSWFLRPGEIVGGQHRVHE